MFLKKNYKILMLLLFLLIILAYVTNIVSIPESIILFENDELNINPILGLRLKETIEVGANLETKEVSNNQNRTINNQKQYNIKLLGINLKKITADIISETKVVPLGNLIGLKLYTKGVLVVGTSEIKGKDQKTYKPYEDAGLKLGDSIIEINGESINTTEELISCVSKCNGEKIDIEYLRDGNILQTELLPVKTDENIYKIGIWVRDAGAGVGTASFYDKKTNSIASLGHSIQDVDTGEIIDISSGEFVTTQITNIKKGEKEKPGKIEGTIENGRLVGKIYTNTEFGVYGKVTNSTELGINEFKEVEVASRNKIKIGKASVICTLEDGKREEYELEIQKIYLNNNENNKSMLVKIIDKRLLDKTGGIIQGMSGSPIIQDGKLIGALTHVLVQKPDTGYAVFADLMIKQMRTVQ